MKKLLTILTAVVMLVSLTACGSDDKFSEGAVANNANAPDVASGD